MPDISIVVPVYNVEKYLTRCVNSIYAQTFSDWELILVDDGSPDSSGRICDENALLDDRVYVIHKINGGLSSARNTGIDWAFAIDNSKWISFIDSDDWVHKQYFQFLFESGEKTNSQISMTGYETTFDSQINDKLLDKKKYKSFCISGKEACLCLYDQDKANNIARNTRYSFVSACVKIYDRNLFQSVRFPNGMIHEDQGTTYKILYKANKVALVDETLYYYFINSNGITHGLFSKKHFDDILLLEEAETFFRKRNDNTMAQSVAIHKKKLTLIYLLESRKAGIYWEIPRKYRIGSFFHQAYDLRKLLGRDKYEYYMNQYYPGYVRIQCYVWRLLKIL